MKKTRTRVLSFDDIFAMKKEAEASLWTARILYSVAMAMMSVTIGVAILVATRNIDVTIVLTVTIFVGLMFIMENTMIDDEKKKVKNARELVEFINSDEEEITIIE